MKSYIKVMKALSDPNRVVTLKLLQDCERCVCEIRAGLGLAQPTVSKHLKVLEEAGLVASRKQGQWVHYRIAPENEFATEALKNLKQWLKDDAGVREADRKMREFACNNPNALPQPA